jgi:succinate dehydrogenase/fumarate reductase-like Fe-S protein
VSPVSLLRLGWYFGKRLIARLFFRQHGLARFEAQYGSEGLFALAPEEREAVASLSKCIACGICDASFGPYHGIARSSLRGPSDLVLAQSRSLPDWDALAPALAQLERGRVEEIEALCPAQVPFERVLRVAKKRAEALRAAREPDTTRRLARGSIQHDPG